jgi:hypothetical protein
MNLQEQIKQLQESRIQEILDDNSISKIEKLKLFDKEKLFDYADYIQTEFPEWEEEAMALEKALAEKQFAEGKSKLMAEGKPILYFSKMTDTIFDPSTFEYEKYETVSYADAIENMIRRKKVDSEGKIVVVTTRGPHTELKKTPEEVIDKLFEFCVKNRLIGYKNDW